MFLEDFITKNFTTDLMRAQGPNGPGPEPMTQKMQDDLNPKPNNCKITQNGYKRLERLKNVFKMTRNRYKAIKT